MYKCISWYTVRFKKTLVSCSLLKEIKQDYVNILCMSAFLYVVFILYHSASANFLMYLWLYFNAAFYGTLKPFVVLIARWAVTGNQLPWTSKEYNEGKIHLSFIPKKSEYFSPEVFVCD